MFELKIDTMTCGHCSATITKAVKSADPKADVAIDLMKKTVQIKTSKDQAFITSQVEEAGYPVTEVKTFAE